MLIYIPLVIISLVANSDTEYPVLVILYSQKTSELLERQSTIAFRSQTWPPNVRLPALSLL